ncbi:Synaptic vesicle transporter SVOP and related transporters (major facilitator superfamily) [Ceraceosorus bombacis]|uniref:Synaptic vesicle transporter SVOP and related transporters (Major facilitator superfamily) n=1 Tax=Ceraceosorus bombacis TaxID=401625 RepID=A0A0P1BEN7_9BASI|nr:Synaptic vesicle transporter SVOP and related transporters (major facilitator superfamily) [Ceraceosorus bombacis]
MIASSSKATSIKQSESTPSNSADSERTKRGSGFSLTSHSDSKHGNEEDLAGCGSKGSAQLLAPSSSDTSSAEDSAARTDEGEHPSHASQTVERESAARSEVWSDREKHGSAIAEQLAGTRQGDRIWVEWEEGDPENPFNFSPTRKWLMTIFATFFTMEVAATAGAYVPGIPSMEASLRHDLHEVSLLGISVYAFGFGLPPLVLAPLSEVMGRNTIYLVSHALYTILFVGIGQARNIQTVIILRFLQGAFGSTGSTMVGGSIADLFSSSDRGAPMALFATAAIFGTGFGPFWAGFVEQYIADGWRWIQHIQAIYTGAFLIIFTVVLKETRGSVILARRASRLRKQTGDGRYMAKSELERASVVTLIKGSLTRPMIMLFTEPVVTAFSLWISLQWGMMYALLESIGLVSALHDYTPSQTGLVFLAICVAALIGNLLNPLSERAYARNYPKRGAEARLYAAMFAGLMFPAGCAIYAWTSYSDVSMAGPIIGIVVLMVAVYIVYLAAFSYLADSYGPYASSALAAQSFSRNMFGAAFPLFTTQMYKNLGYQWASMLAGLIGLVLGCAPFLLFRWGPQIRAKSRLSSELERLGLL